MKKSAVDELRDDLTEFIRERMPWPYFDVDRDDQEATETARAIAETVMVPMISAFTDITLSAKRESKESK